MKSEKILPGDFAMWVFILAELAVFGIFFLVFLVNRFLNPEMFHESALHLDRTKGLINTFSLITASYLVVLAVENIKKGHQKPAVYFLFGAIVSGFCYVGVKTIEYIQAFSLGLDLSTNTFFTFYFFLTFFHFAHVLLGMIILGYIAIRLSKGRYMNMPLHGVESGAVYWHMIDLVWVILFTLLYVLR